MKIRSTKNHGQERTLRSKVTVEPLLSTLAGQRAKFMACVEVGSGHLGVGGSKRRACRFGKNPRKAIAAALHAAATKIGARSGAFAGVRRKRR